ncbi:MAG: LysM peptidoglycan-binding domain-containing protein, partial [Vibrionaceae bacterium]
NTQMELAMAAKLAGISLSTLQELNPAYNRWATAPDGANHLLLPISKLKYFKQNFTKIDKKELQVTRYQVKTGDALYRIAKNHNVNLNILMKINALKTQELKIGQELILPNPQNLAMLATLNDASAAVATTAEPPQAKPALITVKSLEKTKTAAEPKTSEITATAPVQAATADNVTSKVSNNNKTQAINETKEVKAPAAAEAVKKVARESQKEAQKTALNSAQAAATATSPVETSLPTQEKIAAAPAQSSAEQIVKEASNDSATKAKTTVAKTSQPQPAAALVTDEATKTVTTLSLEDKKIAAAQLRAELKAKLIEELKEELKAELQAELVAAIKSQKATPLQKTDNVVANASAPAADAKSKTDAELNTQTPASPATTASIDAAPASAKVETIAKADSNPQDQLKAPSKDTSRAHLATDETNKAQVVASNAIEHVIASGESLWGIARKYQVSYQDLLAWNDLGTQAVIIPGKKLLINVNQATQSAQKIATAKAEQAQPQIKTPALAAESSKPIELALVN